MWKSAILLTKTQAKIMLLAIKTYIKLLFINANFIFKVA